MTRVGFIADPHLACHRYLGRDVVGGLNWRARHVAERLAMAYKLSRDQGCESLYVCGDLFDTSDPSPALIAAAMRALPGDEVRLLLGNHDMRSLDENAFLPLREGGWVTIHEPCFSTYFHPHIEGDVSLELVIVPFGLGPVSEWLPTALDEALEGSQKRGPRLLVAHFGIVGPDTPPYLRACEGAIDFKLLDALCHARGISGVLAGDWHKQAVYQGPRGTTMVQVGALVPTGFDNPGLEGYGALVVFDSESGLEFYEVPGLRFVKADRVPQLPNVDGMTYALRVGDESAEPGWCADGRVHVEVCAPEREVADEEARAESRSAETLSAAVSSYVDAAELLPGVDRDELRTTCLGYLTGGGA